MVSKRLVQQGTDLKEDIFPIGADTGNTVVAVPKYEKYG